MKKIFLALAVLLVLGLASCGNSATVNSTTNSFDNTSNIQIYTRDTTSGTREAFFKGIEFDDAVKDNSQLATGYVEVDGNGSMISSVNGDKYGIGYISLSSLDGSGLNGLQYNGVDASIDNVLNDSYQLKRPFMYITRDDWSGLDPYEQQISEAFLAYMFTVDGKTTIKNNHGIVSINENDKLWDDIKADYSVCSLDNSNVTVKFGGSTSVENIAKALSSEFSAKCGNFIPEHNHTGSGDAYKRVQGSESDGANYLDIGFASRNFDPEETATAGTFGQICWDAVVVVVNGDNNSIANITTDEIKKIYQGQITSWDNIA